MKIQHFLPLCAILSLLAVNGYAESTTDKNTQAEKDAGKHTEPPIEKQIQPRNMGATWWSASYSLNEDGKFAKDGVVTEKVIDTKVIDGVTCYQIEWIYDWRTLLQKTMNTPLGPDDTTYFWEYIDEQGSHDFSDYDTTDKSVSPSSLDQFDLTLPYPTSTGHDYSFGKHENWVIVSDSHKVETPLGEFECVVYQQTDTEAEPHNRYRFFESPGVGLVAFEWDEKIDGKFVMWSRELLYKYDLNMPEADADESVTPPVPSDEKTDKK